MLKLFNNYIAKVVGQAIDRRLSDVKRMQPPVGFNPIEHIRGAMFHWVLVPFNGIPVWCFLRCLNKTQIDACGGMTLIGKAEEASKKVPTMKDIIDIRNRQEEISKAVLVKPSFDDIYKMIGCEDTIYSNTQKELEELRKIDIQTLPAKHRKEFSERMERLELSVAFILPEDAMGVLTGWALGTDVTDIKKLTEDQLFDAACLAERGNDNPSDHVSGIFTDRDKADIDSCAWNVHGKRVEEAKRNNKEGSRRWIGGGK